MPFKLSSQLSNDSLFVVDLPLCQVRLINDSQYPWLVLIPRVAGLTEIIDLTDQQQSQLWQESKWVSHVLRSHFAPIKLNVAMIGNVVSQLHVHHVARFTSDVSWPKPIWGQVPMQAYNDEQGLYLCNILKQQIVAMQA